MEPFYPLVVFVCEQCFLVQLEEFESPDHIFSDYSYFSSFSETWVDHAKIYADMIVERLGLDRNHRVVELASNDGYLLQHFVAKGIPVLGIEPAANVAEAAVKKDIPTVVEFFGESMAHRLVAEGVRRGSYRRKQCPGARSPSERLCQRHEDPAKASRRDHTGVSSSDASHGRESI